MGEGSIERCGVAADVSGDSVGGVIGAADEGEESPLHVGINNTYALGELNGLSVIDGLIGLIGASEGSEMSLTNSYAAWLFPELEGDVGTENGDPVGGLVGGVKGEPTLSAEAAYWDDDLESGLDPVGISFENVDLHDAEGLKTHQMQGEAASGNMKFDFGTTWYEVVAGQSIENPEPTDDGYPILESLDAGTQLQGQGVGLLTDAAVEIGGEDVTIENTTVDGG